MLLFARRGVGELLTFGKRRLVQPHLRSLSAPSFDSPRLELVRDGGRLWCICRKVPPTSENTTCPKTSTDTGETAVPVRLDWTTKELEVYLSDTLCLPIKVQGKPTMKLDQALLEHPGLQVNVDQSKSLLTMDLSSEEQAPCRSRDTDVRRRDWECRQNVITALDRCKHPVMTIQTFKETFAPVLVNIPEDPLDVLRALHTCGKVQLQEEENLVWLDFEVYQRAARVGIATQPIEHKEDEGKEHAEMDSLGAGIVRWGMATGILAGSSFLFYLTYDFFSWDIVEPVTYFVGAFFSTVGYFWWLLTHHDLSLSNIVKVLFSRKGRP